VEDGFFVFQAPKSFEKGEEVVYTYGKASAARLCTDSLSIFELIVPKSWLTNCGFIPEGLDDEQNYAWLKVNMTGSSETRKSLVGQTFYPVPPDCNAKETWAAMCVLAAEEEELTGWLKSERKEGTMEFLGTNGMFSPECRSEYEKAIDSLIQIFDDENGIIGETENEQVARKLKSSRLQALKSCKEVLKVL
jgi:hypothetical protein